MNNIIRAWKDPIYRSTLSETEQAELSSPAGMIELAGTDLDHVAGGGGKGGNGGGHGGGCGPCGSKRSKKSKKSKRSKRSRGSRRGGCK